MFRFVILHLGSGLGLSNDYQIVENESAQLPGCGDSAPVRYDHIGIRSYRGNTEGYVVCGCHAYRGECNLCLQILEQDKI